MQNKQEGRVAQVDVSEDPTGVRSAVSDQEKAARVDLAAAHRLADIFGWTNLIYNHITLRVPGESSHFLLKPNDQLFNEVTASSLVKLDLDGNPVGEAGLRGNVARLHIHTALLKARTEINRAPPVHTADRKSGR